MTCSSKPAEYRQHAHECLRLASATESREHHTFLLEMAQAWFRLAQEHERELVKTEC